jgi:hypothetical protein
MDDKSVEGYQKFSGAYLRLDEIEPMRKFDTEELKPEKFCT